MAESEHNVKININGNDASAVGSLSRVKSALHGIQSVAAGVTRALGWIHLAVNGATMLVNAFKWLKDKISESARELAKFRWDAQMRSAANETARLVGWHEKLAKLMKDELDTLSKQRAVASIEEQGRKDLEDGRREADRARQIYEANTPEEEQELRDKFAAEDEQRERDNRKAARRERIRQLDDEDSVYSSKARSLRENNDDIDRQIADERFNLRRANGKEEEAEPIRKRIEALEQRKKANEAEIAQFEKEAKFRRDQIAALEAVKDYEGESAASLSAKQREKEKARDNDKATTEADREWKERRERDAKKKDIDEAVDNQKAPGDKKAILDAQAESAQSEADALRREYEEEMKKPAATRDAAKLADLRAKIDERESTAESYRDQSKQITVDENAKRAGDLEAFADRAASFDGVSQNRLTAMGLGSGVSASGTVQSDVRKLVDLLKENVKATKNIHLGDLPDATYSE